MQVTTKSKLAAAAAVVGAALIGWGVFGGSEQPDAQLNPRQQAVTQAPAPVAPVVAATATPTPAAAPVVVGKTATPWTAAYTSRDPYPTFIALREARQKGTFGAAYELHNACLQGLAAISKPPNAFGGFAVDGQHAARLQAGQEIQVRCGRFNDDALIYAEALPGDEYGQRYRKALDALSEGVGGPDALAEIAAQGMAATATARLQTPRHWRGESWLGREQEFITAVSIAARTVTGAPDGGVDLRDLTSCYRGSKCGVDYVQDRLRFHPADRHAAIRALAQDMAAALRAGDLKPWKG